MDAVIIRTGRISWGPSTKRAVGNTVTLPRGGGVPPPRKPLRNIVVTKQQADHDSKVPSRECRQDMDSSKRCAIEMELLGPPEVTPEFIRSSQVSVCRAFPFQAAEIGGCGRIDRASIPYLRSLLTDGQCIRFIGLCVHFAYWCYILPFATELWASKAEPAPTPPLLHSHDIEQLLIDAVQSFDDVRAELNVDAEGALHFLPICLLSIRASVGAILRSQYRYFDSPGSQIEGRLLLNGIHHEVASRVIRGVQCSYLSPLGAEVPAVSPEEHNRPLSRGLQRKKGKWTEISRLVSGPASYGYARPISAQLRAMQSSDKRARAVQRYTKQHPILHESRDPNMLDPRVLFHRYISADNCHLQELFERVGILRVDPVKGDIALRLPSSISQLRQAVSCRTRAHANYERGDSKNADNMSTELRHYNRSLQDLENRCKEVAWM
jgi:hypothetical protein